jgi:predicted DNA-binding ribbon-helix-helix protein
VSGRITSVNLEDAFWIALREIAAEQGVHPNELVSKIDRERDPNRLDNLSSAIRLFVLNHYRGKRK